MGDRLLQLFPRRHHGHTDETGDRASCSRPADHLRSSLVSRHGPALRYWFACACPVPRLRRNDPSRGSWRAQAKGPDPAAAASRPVRSTRPPASWRTTPGRLERPRWRWGRRGPAAACGQEAAQQRGNTGYPLLCDTPGWERQPHPPGAEAKSSDATGRMIDALEGAVQPGVRAARVLRPRRLPTGADGGRAPAGSAAPTSPCRSRPPLSSKCPPEADTPRFLPLHGGPEPCGDDGGDRPLADVRPTLCGLVLSCVGRCSPRTNRRPGG